MDGGDTAVTLKMWMNLKQHMENRARTEDLGHAFTSSYPNIRIPLNLLFDVFESGLEGKLPIVWLPFLRDMEKRESDEYLLFLALRNKYGKMDSAPEVQAVAAITEPLKREVPSHASRGGKRKKRKATATNNRELAKSGNVCTFK